MRFQKDKQTAFSFWLNVGLAVLSTALFALTLFSRDWIEEILPVDPDRHSGSLEWLIVGALFIAMAAFSTRAWSKWRNGALRRLSDGDHPQIQDGKGSI
jgi:undecaprenyl pyrophosphate phosphatase UppP